MLCPAYTRRFEKDIRRMRRRGKNLEKIKIIIRSLILAEISDPVHRDLRLTGNWQGRKECHIESDWPLICNLEIGGMIFERTGPHSDLFRK